MELGHWFLRRIIENLDNRGWHNRGSTVFNHKSKNAIHINMFELSLSAA